MSRISHFSDGGCPECQTGVTQTWSKLEMSREEPSTHSEVGFTLSEQIGGKPSKNGKKFLYAWFHVRLGARSRGVVKGKGGGAKISWRTKFEGGIARSRRDPASTMVADSAPTLSEQIRAKPSRICGTPGSTCDWGRGCGTL